MECGTGLGAGSLRQPPSCPHPPPPGGRPSTGRLLPGLLPSMSVYVQAAASDLTRSPPHSAPEAPQELCCTATGQPSSPLATSALPPQPGPPFPPHLMLCDRAWAVPASSDRPTSTGPQRTQFWHCPGLRARVGASGAPTARSLLPFLPSQAH